VARNQKSEPLTKVDIILIRNNNLVIMHLKLLPLARIFHFADTNETRQTLKWTASNLRKAMELAETDLEKL